MTSVTDSNTVQITNETTIKDLVDGIIDIDSLSHLTQSKLSKNLDSFLLSYSGYSSCLTLTCKFTKELNCVVNTLSNSGILELDGKNRNGLYKIISVSDDVRNVISAPVIKSINRVSEKVNFIDKPYFGKIHENQLLTTHRNPVKFESYLAMRYIQKQTAALEKGVDFSLTLSDMRRLLKRKTCYYSGVKLTLEGAHALTLDRIDDNIGYVKGNVVACSMSVNYLKNKIFESGEYTKEMSNKEIVKTLKNFLKALS